MEYIHAALLLHKAGKEIKESSLKKVLEAAGVKADSAKLKALISALKDVNIEEAIATPIAAVAAPAPAAGTPAGDAPAAKEEPEDEPEEKKEEEAAAGLAALFG